MFRILHFESEDSGENWSEYIVLATTDIPAEDFLEDGFVLSSEIRCSETLPSSLPTDRELLPEIFQ